MKLESLKDSKFENLKPNKINQLNKVLGGTCYSSETNSAGCTRTDGCKKTDIQGTMEQKDDPNGNWGSWQCPAAS